ncbi:TPA: hypothetical protein ACTW9O_001490 [Raoultella ornithinolytica]
MYHLDNTSGVPEMPEPKETQSISPRWFGESQEQGGISWPGADWFNIVQAELLAILSLAEESPDKTKFNQIASAIQSVSDLFRKDAAKADGASLLGYRFNDVYAVLSRLGTVEDMGATLTHLGRNPVEDQKIFDEQSAILGQDLLHYGGLFLGKRTRGVRRNAVGLSVRMNQTGASIFDPQITGVSNARAIAKYGSMDGAGAYIDNRSVPFEAWEIVPAATYTANSFTPSTTETYQNIRKGDVVRTNHSHRCWAMVTGKSEGVVYVDEWAVDANTVVTPEDGVGLYVNIEDKIWTLNMNLFMDAGCKATKAALMELGMVNNAVPMSNEVNCIDAVVLPQSTYGCNTSFLSRAGGPLARWMAGFFAQGAKWGSFVATDGLGGPADEASFKESTSSPTGFLFGGWNAQYSIRWRYAGSSVYPAALNPHGFKICGGSTFGALSSGSVAALSTACYELNNNGAFSVLLPSTNLVAGQEIEFSLVGLGAVTFSCVNSTIMVNGSQTFIHAPSMTFTSVKARWNGTAWRIFRG